jgi:hypothetical protein
MSLFFASSVITSELPDYHTFEFHLSHKYPKKQWVTNFCVIIGAKSMAKSNLMEMFINTNVLSKTANHHYTIAQVNRSHFESEAKINKE